MTAQEGNVPSIGAAIGNQDLGDEQRGLVDQIDKLRDKLRFAQLDNVKLPQVVVFGSQSAGKSSVLEAITGTPFPRDSGACTRFATEIRLRRGKEEKFSIRIIPDKNNRSSSEKERLRQFGSKVDESTSFQDLMRLAVDQIAPKNIPGRFATGDVLVVEKEGPMMPLLTVVDLPGLVKVTNNEHSVDDIKAINDLTDRYMKNSRTMILAVVGGNDDYIQAPVLMKVREFDPSGGRTIGVLTKPDLIESIGLEEKFIALVNNKDQHNHFELGWYVLLNPGPRKTGQEWPSTEERNQAEVAFFTTGNWSILPPTMCGAAALKQKLSAQLLLHIKRHVPILQKEIQKAHNDCMAELKSLGTGKDKVEEMKEELLHLCSDSKDLATPAVQGTYKNPPGRSFFPRSVDRKGIPPSNLRARAVEENWRFAERVRKHGSKLQFSSASESQATEGMKLGNTTKQDFARNIVEPLLTQNKGTEFPLDHSPSLVYALFQDNVENWFTFAQEHKDNLGLICSEFLDEVIDAIWPERMREPLRTEFLDPPMRAIQEEAQRELAVLQRDLHFEVQPYDPEYEDRMKQWHAEAPQDRPHTEAEEVLEKMLIHYELTAKIFIRNVITQVVERHLLQGLLTIFSWVKVNRLTEESVRAIAAENQETTNKRVTLNAKLKDIEESRDICNKLAMRKDRGMYGRDELDDGGDSSNEEESTPVLRNPRQRINRKPTPMAESSSNTPVQSQWRPAQEGHPESATAQSDGALNGSIDQNFENASPLGPGAAVSANHSKVKMDLPKFSNDLEEHTAADYYPSPTSTPRYPTPPPSRAEKYPFAASSSGSHQTSPMPGQFPVQPPRSGKTGHQYSNSHSQSDLNWAQPYFDNYSESTPKKPSRKLFGPKN